MKNKQTAIMAALCFGAALHPPFTQAEVLLGPVTNTANGHNYFLLSSSSWLASEAEGISLGGHLTTINNDAEQSWIFSTFGSFASVDRSLWIGLNDTAIEGSFIWADGAPVTFANWNLGEPDGGLEEPREDFVAMIRPGAVGATGGAWFDTDPDNNAYSGYTPVNGVIEVVPEPSTVALMLTAPLLFATLRSRRISPGKLIQTFFATVFACSGLSAQTNSWEPSPEHKQLAIWPGAVSDAQPVAGPEDTKTMKDKLVAGKPWVKVENVSRPTMTVYSPKENNTGVAVVVFPDGGYNVLAIDLEGTEICESLASKGTTGVLLKYRVPGSGPSWDKKLKGRSEPKTALQDAQRVVGLVRFHAAEWHIDPHKIGVLGFSAGGHLVADISMHFDKRLYSAVDGADNESCRPDFGVALYPGHMLENTPKAYELNPKISVTKDTPPMFLLQAQNDPVDDVQNSLVYYIALRKAGVPVEMHFYAEGGHAFGLRPTKFPITGWL